ncbi:hypothetical protein F2Q68_00000087 [Brassica cretica]|uniref:Uncharacterized protein n=1 Tax=Brassica cretica TaxID=69181 RepID=A0A8S9J3G3_BRACR|nr:hypothetical protein F2Q68_00000087 [Brassica cretica]
MDPAEPPGSLVSPRGDNDDRGGQTESVIHVTEAIAKEGLSKGGPSKGSSWAEDGVGLAEQMEKQRDGIEKAKDEREKASEEQKKNEVNGNAVELNEIEEGQIVEGWSDVSPGKVSRNQSPLKFGQVKILTPSRFLVLNEINDNGELVTKDGIEEATEANKMENEGSVVVESSEVVEKMDDEIGNSGGKTEALVIKRNVEWNVNNTDVLLEKQEHSAEVREANAEKDDMVIAREEKEIRKPSYSDIVAPSDAQHRSLKHCGWNLSSSRSVNNFGLSRSGVIRPRLSAMTGSEVGDSGYDESEFDPTLTNDDLKPTKPSQRTFSWLDMSSLWIGLVVGVPTYYLAGSLVDLGMAWWQGIATVVAANLILLVPLVLTAQPGTMYGISFPVLARSSFGIRGAHIPTLLRALVGCGWYGIETWIGGEAIFLLLPSHIKNSALSHTLPWLGTSPLEFSCFIVFWLAQLCIVWRGMDGIRKLEKYSAPVLITLTSCLLVWSYVKAGGFGHMLSLSSKLTSSQFWTLFFPSLTANISFWATLALNIPDFSRFAKSQTDQIIGQVGLPVFMGLFTFVGLAVTSSTSIIFGRVISNPIQLLGQIGGLATTLLAILGISLATITTNIAANVVAPANALVNLNPKVFTFGRGALLTAVLGIVCQPWRLLKSSESFVYTWLIGYSALLGPIGGIVLADYYLIKKMKLNVGDLYSLSASGEYYYSKGYNAAAVVALVAGIIPVVPGFLHKVGVLSKISNGFVVVYDNALFFSFIIAGFVYWMLMSRLRRKQSSSSQPLL